MPRNLYEFGIFKANFGFSFLKAHLPKINTSVLSKIYSYEILNLNFCEIIYFIADFIIWLYRKYKNSLPWGFQVSFPKKYKWIFSYFF